MAGASAQRVCLKSTRDDYYVAVKIDAIDVDGDRNRSIESIFRLPLFGGMQSIVICREVQR